MQEVFRASPAELRSRRRQADRLVADGGLALRLPTVAGYDWDAVRAILAARRIPGVEEFEGATYRRTITVAGAPGLLEVSPGGQGCLLAYVHLPYWEGLIHVVGRVTQLLGTERDESAGVAALRHDPVLGPLVTALPGLVVPGVWNRIEAGVWAILACHPDRDQLLGALVAELGSPVPGLPGGLTHTFPAAPTVTYSALAAIGFPSAEARAIVELATALADDNGATRTANGSYLAWRMGRRDAFPLEEPSVQAALAELRLAAPVSSWRPWLALAAVHLMAYGDSLRGADRLAAGARAR